MAPPIRFRQVRANQTDAKSYGMKSAGIPNSTQYNRVSRKMLFTRSPNRVPAQPQESIFVRDGKSSYLEYPNIYS